MKYIKTFEEKILEFVGYNQSNIDLINAHQKKFREIGGEVWNAWNQYDNGTKEVNKITHYDQAPKKVSKEALEYAQNLAKKHNINMKYIKTFEEVTYDQAVSSGKIGNKIKDYINKHYPEYSNKDNNILGRYGHSLSKSSITKITKLATSKKDEKLKELLDEFKSNMAQVTRLT